ncbi:MAG: hypothetical protein WC465_00075 [Patescibacteria group bacterium]
MKKFAIFLSVFALLAFVGGAVLAENRGNNPPKKEENKFNWQQFRVSTSTIPLYATTTPAENLACLQATVATREASIDTAYDTMSAAIKSALATRKTELNTAWGIVVNKDRRTAIKAAWTKFNKANRDARSVYKTAVRAAWKKFNTDSKSCNVPWRLYEAQGTDVSL